MNYLKIEKTSIANGEGIRVVLWCSGCRLHCKNCQNPQSWDFNAGKPFDEEAKKELFEALDKPYIQGITFSGGHPLENENLLQIYNLIQNIRLIYKSKDIWLYTGLTWEDIMSKNDDITDKLRQVIVSMCDVVVDGRYIEEQKDITLNFRGSRNQRLIDVKETLKQDKVILWQD